MPQRLTDMQIDKVSLVPRGANGRTFAVLKHDQDNDEERWTLLRKIAGAMGIPYVAVPTSTESGAGAPTSPPTATPVTKSETFADIIAGDELTDALYDSWETLESAMWNAIYAWDADAGEPASMETKQALVAQNLDEFKAWLLGVMDDAVSIAKQDEHPSAVRRVDALVRKVGKKISAARLERLQAAADALSEVLAEVESSEDDDVQKRADAQEEAMTGEELAEITKAMTQTATEAIEKAVAPLAADIEELKKARGAAAEPEQPEPDDGVQKDESEEDAITIAGLAKAITSLAERMESVEKAAGRGVQTSVTGQDETVEKSAGWKARM